MTATSNHGTIRYELGGADANRFDIDDKTGQITTEVALNFEGPNGADDQCTVANACVVTVTATDSTGEATATPATVNIAITNVNEKPTFPTEALMMLESPENRDALFDTSDGPVTTEAGVTYAATDPERRNITYRLMGADASKFQLSATRVLSFRGRNPTTRMPGDAKPGQRVRGDRAGLGRHDVRRPTWSESPSPTRTKGRTSSRASDTINYAENGNGPGGDLHGGWTRRAARSIYLVAGNGRHHRRCRNPLTSLTLAISPSTTRPANSPSRIGGTAGQECLARLRESRGPATGWRFQHLQGSGVGRRRLRRSSDRLPQGHGQGHERERAGRGHLGRPSTTQWNAAVPGRRRL